MTNTIVIEKCQEGLSKSGNLGLFPPNKTKPTTRNKTNGNEMFNDLDKLSGQTKKYHIVCKKFENDQNNTYTLQKQAKKIMVIKPNWEWKDNIFINTGLFFGGH